ncbi:MULTISPECIES: hypothetical protein [unclassified Streptomyces]|uniref:hypothetical protein n=1 Tax=unclassified Streptomyces TaxID=2593676 RepID=UPI0038087965
MTTGAPLGRSVARAHLPELIGLFGADGCLRISTASAEPGPLPVGEESKDDQQN